MSIYHYRRIMAILALVLLVLIAIQGVHMVQGTFSYNSMFFISTALMAGVVYTMHRSELG